MTKFRECGTCGVAFDVGKDRCVEQGCVGANLPEPKPTILKVPAMGRKRYIQPDRKVDRIHTRWLSARARAKKKGIPFDLTHEFIEQIINKPCIYCGSVEKGSELDRKNNLGGYTQNNVIPACRRCNTVKSMYLTYEDMSKVAVALGWKTVNSGS